MTYELRDCNVLGGEFSESSALGVSRHGICCPQFDTYLTISAARSPAPVTMMEWGFPFFLEALAKLSGFLQKLPRKSGSLSRVLCSVKVVESWMAFAAHGVSYTGSNQIRINPMEISFHLPEIVMSDSSTGLRSVPNLPTFWAR